MKKPLDKRKKEEVIVMHTMRMIIYIYIYIDYLYLIKCSKRKMTPTHHSFFFCQSNIQHNSCTHLLTSYVNFEKCSLPLNNVFFS